MNLRRKSLYLPFFLLAIWTFCQIVRAESPPLKIYTTEEGLAHDSVNKIVRDSRGFLWFCTAEGLSRFDGARFKNFTQDDGLPHRSVNDLLETRAGLYFVATNSGLAIFNPDGKAYRWNVTASKLEVDSSEPPLFEPFVPRTGNRQKQVITALAEDAAGKIWIGTDNGVYVFVRRGDEWTFEEKTIEAAGDKSYSVSFFFTTSQGDFLVGTAYGVFKITPDEKFIRLTETGKYSIIEDRRGQLWLGSGAAAEGVGVFRLENDRLELLQTFDKKDGLPENAFHFALKQTSDGRIFVGQHDGLSEYLPDAPEDAPKFRVLKTDKVTTIEEDAGGNVWFGSELKGAWKLAGKGFSIFGEADGITGLDDLRAIYETRDGQIVVPLRQPKSLVFADGKFTGVAPSGLTKRSWGWHFLDLQSKDGEWWIGTERGLYRYPKVAAFADLSRTPPKKIYTAADGLPGNEIFNTFEDSRGDIWFTVIGVENSLVRWERATDRLIPTTAADGLPKFNGPLSFAEDRRGSIWMGFYFGGLARFRDGKFEYFTKADGLPESQIIDLLADSDGRLWIATSGQGLYVLDDPGQPKPEFRSISTIEGLSSNQIICLTEDRFGRVYAGTGRGINRIDKQGGIRIFSQADGLPSNYVMRCGADSRGFLWFVAQNTLLRFAPEQEKPMLPPPVYIDKISVNGVPQKISALGEAEIEPLELAHDQSQIQIDFFALAFGAEQNIRYQYRLDEQEWSAPTEQQTVNLNLAPGTHRFAVRAVRSDNAANQTTARAAFKILPPVWQRWWFIALAALLVSALILSLYRFRITNLRAINAALSEAKLAEQNLRRAREERLNELERVRSRIATDLHDDIGASLTQIAILSEVAQAQSKGSGANESLTRITDVSNELVEAMSDIVWAINPSKDHLSDLTQRMRRFASDVLSAKGISVHFDFPEASGETVVSTNLRRELFLIFKESVNNIAKHSQARRVGIALAIEDGDLRLRIRDDGKGFSTDFSADEIDYGGNGIASMRRRAGEMNGFFEIESEKDGGTTVFLRLPLDNFSRS